MKTPAKESFVGYIGDRVPNSGGGAPVWFVDGSAKVPLDPRHDLRNHSPDGFQWGYGGSGPGQLALAICVNAVGEERGQRIYQDFKFAVVAHLGDAWELSRQFVVGKIAELEAARDAER
jgi:prepilin-type processing-associated H-X9-DG protein